MKKLEQVLEQKEIDEQAKNLLQGILYKVEVSYKDYKKVKGKKKKEEKYIQEIIEKIDKRCNKISIVKLSQKLADEEIQQALEKNKYYVGDEIVSYPIEEKILYAIEKKSNHKKILNNKYEETAVALSDLINTGKDMDRVEVLRDFNGWSWTTIPKELENIEANLIYQTLQIVLGEEFLDNWCEDKDGIIDYLELFVEEIGSRYGEEIASESKELLVKIAMINTTRNNNEFAQHILDEIQIINKEINEYEDSEEKIVQITENKKKLLKQLNEIEKILGQKTKLEEISAERNIFNIKILKRELNSQKQELLNQIENSNYLLKPSNYLEEKNKLIARKEKLEIAHLSEDDAEKLIIQFIQNFLKCFEILVENTTEAEEIVRLIYQFRYFLQLSFNTKKRIKEISKLKKQITETEKKLIEKAIEQKVIVDMPFEIMKHVLETRIIILEELYYKITEEDGKKYVQIFDENISEEKFEITPTEKREKRGPTPNYPKEKGKKRTGPKLPKKIKIFI